MNKKLVLTISAAVVAIIVSGITTSLKAQSNRIFSLADPATVTAVDRVAKTITISYAPPPQVGAPCSPTYCPPSAKARKPEVIIEGQVLLLNGFHNGLEKDFSGVQVGDNPAVYLRSDGTTEVPYVVIDSNILPPGCKATDLYCSGQGSSGVGATTTISIDQDLKVGMQNAQVIRLQKKLQDLDYFPRNQLPTGYFGSVTKKAIIDFQTAKGLPATGFVGPLTKSALGQ